MPMVIAINMITVITTMIMCIPAGTGSILQTVSVIAIVITAISKLMADGRLWIARLTRPA